MSLQGRILADLMFLTERCVFKSINLIESTSSSKNSTLNGFASEGEKISIIPPLTENWPTPSIASTLSYLSLIKLLLNSFKS